MKVTSTLKMQLITAAKIDVKEKAAAHARATKELAEAQDVLFWADKLVVGNDMGSPTVTNVVNNSIDRNDIRFRYFVASRSGLTKGHYIRLYADGSVDCTCPGFINRGYCWATNKVKASAYALPAWNRSNSIFESNRSVALNYA